VTDDLPPGLLPAPRIVKPRFTQRRPLPIVAVAGDEVLTEAGELWTLDELVEHLPTLPPTLFATIGGADFLAYLDGIFTVSHPITWQWRASDNAKRAYGNHPNARQRHTRRIQIAVHFFGFKEHKNSHYHKLIDPVSMYGHRLDSVYPSDAPLIMQILEWSVTLRDFCAQNNLEVKPTIGAISSQLLTDPRFYPEARRKVPAPTNQRVRDHLPGNHYRLLVPVGHRDYTAYNIDQRRAHHYHAQTVRFPHADHTYAYGYFQNLTDYYRDRPSPKFMGLYCLDLLAPVSGWYHSWLATAKRETEVGRELTHRFVYTNELPHLYDMGYRVLGVRAAWGSHHRDTGLNKLAQWCCEQLDNHGDAKWLKPLLLSTYGTLASRATDAEAIFKHAKKGTPTTVLTGRRSLTGISARRPMKLEPAYVNVLQRGMIEAACRSESVGMTQHLEFLNHHVLHIYADGIFVEVNEDNPLPELPEPWRLKLTHTHWRPENPQAYTSDQETKRPGNHRDITDRRMTGVRRPIGDGLPAARTAAAIFQLNRIST
jgi:hypothetical protein